MDDALDEYHKECGEMRLAAMIWWLILWYTSDEGRLEIPSEQQWLTCELVAALIEEVEGKKFYYSWRHDRTNKEQAQEWDEWPSYVNGQLDKCRAVNPNAFGATAIEGRLRDLIKRFARYKVERVHSEKDWMSELRIFHEQIAAKLCRRSTCIPDREMHTKAVGELLRYTSAHHAEVCGWCREIGKIMRPYIERDVAFIKKHYAW